MPTEPLQAEEPAQKMGDENRWPPGAMIVLIFAAIMIAIGLGAVIR